MTAHPEEEAEGALHRSDASSSVRVLLMLLRSWPAACTTAGWTSGPSGSCSASCSSAPSHAGLGELPSCTSEM